VPKDQVLRVGWFRTFIKQMECSQAVYFQFGKIFRGERDRRKRELELKERRNMKWR
jgi:hypothetical protein